MLQHLDPPPGFPKSKGRSIKMKDLKYCILNNALYWKDRRGVLLIFLEKSEVEKVMNDFHKGDCGGHIF